MKKVFTAEIRGYSKEEVDTYIGKLVADYEDALNKKHQRMLDFGSEIQDLKCTLADTSNKLAEYASRENCIAKALVVAEQKAQMIEDEAKEKAVQEGDKIRQEIGRAHV